MNDIYIILCWLHVFEHLENEFLISLHLKQSKYTKIHKQEIPTIGHNVFEFFCVCLYTEFLSDLYKKFQVASTYDTNAETKLGISSAILFTFSYL